MRPKPQPGRRWTFAAALLLSVALASPLVAQQPGDTVEILIDVAFPQPEPPARVNDVIMVTGRSLGTVDIAGAASASMPFSRRFSSIATQTARRVASNSSFLRTLESSVRVHESQR